MRSIGSATRRIASTALVGAAAVALGLAGTTGSAWASTSSSASASSAASAASSTATTYHDGVKLASLNPGDGVPAADLAASDIDTCYAVAAKAGFSFNKTVSTALGEEPQIVVALSVAMAESSCNPSATNINTNGSEDRGLWQINNAAWPNVSDSCAFQAQCNADAAWNISDHGSDWGPWATFNSGAWESYLSTAKSALSGGVTFQLEDKSAGTCLDADSSNVANGGKIFQWACNGSDNYQRWTVVDSVGDLFILKNVGAGTCLDADGSSSGNGSPIFQWSCNGSDHAQQWWFLGSGDLNTNGNADANLQNSQDGT